MPHITISAWPGRTEEQKKALAARIQQITAEELQREAGHISVSFREIDPQDWPAFYRDEIYSIDGELLIPPTAYEEPRFIVKPDRTEYVTPDGTVLAVIEYPEAGPDTVEITHTVVDASLQGQGIAGKLTERAAAYLALQGKKVIPTCSYAQTWFQMNLKYKDMVVE